MNTIHIDFFAAPARAPLVCDEILRHLGLGGAEAERGRMSCLDNRADRSWHSITVRSTRQAHLTEIAARAIHQSCGEIAATVAAANKAGTRFGYSTLYNDVSFHRTGSWDSLRLGDQPPQRQQIGVLIQAGHDTIPQARNLYEAREAMRKACGNEAARRCELGLRMQAELTPLATVEAELRALESELSSEVAPG